MSMYKVFIHTNQKQYIGALLSKYTIERYTKHRNKFSIEFIVAEQVPALTKMFGKEYIRGGECVHFDPQELQSFTLTRFMAPELMHYSGKAVVIDPDVFSYYTDIWELFSLKMNNCAILCRRHTEKDWGTSVMLLDNAKLMHWSLQSMIEDLLLKKLDYKDLMGLRKEHAKIGILGNEWNSFDFISAHTKLLHNTHRNTQPWRVGLPLGYTPRRMKPIFRVISREWIHTMLGRNPHKTREHPDKNQTAFFFGHLKSALQEGAIPTTTIEEGIAKQWIRKDVFDVLQRVDAL